MVYNPDPRTRDEETVFVNPRIISFSDDKDWQVLGEREEEEDDGVRRPKVVCHSLGVGLEDLVRQSFGKDPRERSAARVGGGGGAGTYPYALLVSKLSRIQLSEFKPCSARACTFIKIFGSGMVPTTFDRSWEDAPWCSPWFAMETPITAGSASTSWNPVARPSPCGRCSRSATEKQPDIALSTRCTTLAPVMLMFGASVAGGFPRSFTIGCCLPGRTSTQLCE
ncbi:PDF1B [Symbiodinium necroappetens]|uniref:PDF1B protein n=1 Tax=Symbiodinium necroappetens TaxID=1628268 RepID=A0A813C5U2_9DINO|nr:PDF1B [Symbiodinium necroappetens]